MNNEFLIEMAYCSKDISFWGIRRGGEYFHELSSGVAFIRKRVAQLAGPQIYICHSQIEIRRSRWGTGDRIVEGGVPHDKCTVIVTFGYISGKLTSRNDASKSANEREMRGKDRKRGRKKKEIERMSCILIKKSKYVNIYIKYMCKNQYV